MKNITIKTIVLSLMCVGLACASDDGALRAHTYYKTFDGRVVTVLPEAFAAATPDRAHRLQVMIEQCVKDLCGAYAVPYDFPPDIREAAQAYADFIEGDCAVIYKIQLLGALLMYLQDRSAGDAQALYYDVKREITHMVDSWESTASLGL
jgi:hypothetical protein